MEAEVALVTVKKASAAEGRAVKGPEASGTVAEAAEEWAEAVVEGWTKRTEE